MGGDYPGPESMDSVLRAMQTNLPGVIQAITREQPGVARTQAEVDAAVSPIYAKTQLDLYNTFGRDLNRIGAEIETDNQLAASAREAAIAKTYGPELVQGALNLQTILDPEFMKGRAQLGKGIDSLLSGMNPNALSGSERAEVERSLARSGAPNPNSNLETVANAMTFGSALQNKQNQFSQTLANVASALPQMKLGFTGFETATRRALTPNTGNQQFIGAQQGTGQNAWSTGNNVFNQASNLQAIKNQKATSLLDDVLKGTQAFSNVAGAFNFA